MIPDSVKNMSGTFSDCTSLVKAPMIPDSVTDLEFTFDGCTSLETVHNWQVDNNNIKAWSYCFGECTSLKSIYVHKESKTEWETSFGNGWGFPRELSISSIVKEL